LKIDQTSRYVANKGLRNYYTYNLILNCKLIICQENLDHDIVSFSRLDIK